MPETTSTSATRDEPQNIAVNGQRRAAVFRGTATAPGVYLPFILCTIGVGFLEWVLPSIPSLQESLYEVFRQFGILVFVCPEILHDVRVLLPVVQYLLELCLAVL